MILRKLPFYLTLMVLLLSTCRCSLPRKSGKLRIMSWNVQNLFDAVDDGTEYSEFDPGRGQWNEHLYQKRLERTGEVILSGRSGSPDLVILQELENLRILEDLCAGPLKSSGLRWHLAIPGFSIIRCGILSRYPLRDIEVVDCGTYGPRPLRPALAFTVETPAGPLRVAAAHWKSPRNGRAATEKTRCREAAVLRTMMEQRLLENSEAEILIIGDLNTPGDGLVRPAALTPWSPEITPKKDTGILYRTDKPERAGLPGGVPVFFDPEPNPETGSPGSFRYHNEWERPDRALLSSGLVNAPGLVFESCRILNDIAGDEKGWPVRWRTDREEGYSDHLPLLLEFGYSRTNEES